MVFLVILDVILWLCAWAFWAVSAPGWLIILVLILAVVLLAGLTGIDLSDIF